MKPITALVHWLLDGYGCSRFRPWIVKSGTSREFLMALTAEEVAGCLQSGADPNERNDDGNTPLHWAAAYNENPAVIVALVEAGRGSQSAGQGRQYAGALGGG